jgi:uncharacterized membrane protein YeaQ/YmgE (transglycosylase-associated protein family)
MSIIIQLISGAVGGNIAGALLKKFSLGGVGNSIVGILGGGIGGQILSLLGLGAPASGSMDVGAIVNSVAGGGVGGGLLMAVVGWIRSAMHKTT